MATVRHTIPVSIPPQTGTSGAIVQRGTSYHYTGCGCGTRTWHGDDIDWIWDCKPPKEIPRMRISYFIPHHNVTGGMKMIMKQIEHLRNRGHWVQAVFRGPEGTPVLPPWAQIDVDAQLLISPSESILTCLKTSEVIIIGYFTQLLEFKDIQHCPGPVFYWDQGHEHLFGDPTGSAEWDRVFHLSMHLPIALGAVSSIVEEILRVHFGRRAPVIPNAIDSVRFMPNPHQRFPDESRESKRVLIVGNPGLRLKNFQVALQALNYVHKKCPQLEVTWICQVQPSVTGVSFPVNYVVNPPQEDLPRLYRDNHDCFLFASVYEAWGMPVLEAMASGVPVVTSKCHGVNMFCDDEVNCLMADPKDANGLGKRVLRVLLDPKLATQLSKKGRETAVQFTWDASMATLEKALYTVASQLKKFLPRPEPPVSSFAARSQFMVSGGHAVGPLHDITMAPQLVHPMSTPAPAGLWPMSGDTAMHSVARTTVPYPVGFPTAPMPAGGAMGFPGSSLADVTGAPIHSLFQLNPTPAVPAGYGPGVARQIYADNPQLRAYGVVPELSYAARAALLHLVQQKLAAGVPLSGVGASHVAAAPQHYAHIPVTRTHLMANPVLLGGYGGSAVSAAPMYAGPMGGVGHDPTSDQQLVDELLIQSRLRSSGAGASRSGLAPSGPTLTSGFSATPDTPYGGRGPPTTQEWTGGGAGAGGGMAVASGGLPPGGIVSTGISAGGYVPISHWVPLTSQGIGGGGGGGLPAPVEPMPGYPASFGSQPFTPLPVSTHYPASIPTSYVMFSHPTPAHSYPARTPAHSVYGSEDDTPMDAESFADGPDK